MRGRRRPALCLGALPTHLDRPTVVLKFAQTLDGRIAATGGDSRWISGDEGTAAHPCDPIGLRWRAGRRGHGAARRPSAHRPDGRGVIAYEDRAGFGASHPSHRDAFRRGSPCRACCGARLRCHAREAPARRGRSHRAGAARGARRRPPRDARGAVRARPADRSWSKGALE